MQRIACSYRVDVMPETMSQSDLRNLFASAAERAGVPLSEGRKVIVLGPPLPRGVSSVAERLVLELAEPRDPTDVRQRLNAHLPEGLHIEQAWIARPGSTEEHPTRLDEAIYLVEWEQAPPLAEFAAAVRQFLLAASHELVREREQKTQRVDARALVYDVRMLAGRDGRLRFYVTVSVGPRGSLRPEEVLLALGFTAAPGTVHARRVALQQSAWRDTQGTRGPWAWSWWDFGI
ncbi:MAG: TIGR03936 family radical SAM-associated protein [Armatimonadota bacterium]